MMIAVDTAGAEGGLLADVVMNSCVSQICRTSRSDAEHYHGAMRRFPLPRGCACEKELCYEAGGDLCENVETPFCAGGLVSVVGSVGVLVASNSASFRRVAKFSATSSSSSTR